MDIWIVLSLAVSAILIVFLGCFVWVGLLLTRKAAAAARIAPGLPDGQGRKLFA